MRMLKGLTATLSIAVLLATMAVPALATPEYRQAIDITFPTRRGATYSDSYFNSRGGGSRVHRATDLMGQHGWPVYAAKAGRVVWAPPAAHPTAGWALQVRGRDGRVYAYYHLGHAGGGRSGAIAAGVATGSWVRRRQVIGYVGDSGNAAGGWPHLHFEIEDGRIRDPFGGRRMNPYASLRTAEREGDYANGRGSRSSRGGPRSPVRESLRQGHDGPRVSAWQRKLNKIRRRNIAVDGDFGPATHAATIQFQRNRGIGPAGPGTVGPLTRAAMARSLARQRRGPAPPAATASLRMGAEGKRVAIWQRKLNKIRRRNIAVDGDFGPATHAATIQFQRNRGIGPAGLGTVGPLTRAAMARSLR
jgi:peptidoglycan hydrolase-like protein with peptidoglycan-binding domain